MNVTHNGVTEKFDRIAVYATADGSRTKEFPLRAGAEAPREFVSAGDTLTLVAVITPYGDETPDAAILREVREQAGELSALLDDAA
jgi:hypothetical protein